MALERYEILAITEHPPSLPISTHGARFPGITNEYDTTKSEFTVTNAIKNLNRF